MFCKRCGSEAHGNALYCQNDGTPLTDSNDSLSIHKEYNRFCSQCSCENTTDSLYCIECGAMQSKITEQASSIVEIPAALKSSIPVHTSVSDLSSRISLNGFKQSGIYAAVAIVITFLLSWMTSSMLNGKLQDLLSNEWSSRLVKDISFISSTDVMMLSHMVGMKYAGSISMLEGNLKTSGGFYILLLIPIVSLLVAGYLANRNAPQRSAIERLVASIPIAVVYAILMAVISLFAGISVKSPDIGMLRDGVLLKTSYSFMPALLHSLMIGFIFTALGSFIGMRDKDKQQGSNISYGISIQRALITSVAGILICMLLVTGILNARSEFSDSGMPGPIKAVVSTQVGGYYWGMTHFNSLSLGMAASYDDKENISYSIMGGLNSESGEIDSDEMDEILGGMWYLFLVPILLHMWAGRQLLRSQTNRFMYELAAYAVSFGVISALFAYMSKVRIQSNLDENFVINFGFSFISTLLWSAIAAFIFAYIGVLIFNRNADAESNQNQQQSVKKMEV